MCRRCVIEEREKRRVISTVARTGPVSVMLTDSTVSISHALSSK